MVIKGVEGENYTVAWGPPSKWRALKNYLLTGTPPEFGSYGRAMTLPEALEEAESGNLEDPNHRYDVVKLLSLDDLLK